MTESYEKRKQMDDRKATILEAVINRYIRTAEPVGSKIIAEEYNLGVSPATIRSEMSALEEMGYLAQPHTSAGRAPTDKGYRFYVDSLRKILALSAGDASSLREKLAELRRLEVEDMLRQIAGMLASRTASVSIILTPGSRRRVYFWGVSHILHQPEFIDLKHFEPLMELLESEYTLAEWLTEEISEPQVHVRIGSENRHEELSGMSLITAGYKMDEEASGIVGLLGPTRMDYGTAIPIVDFTARNLSRIIRDE